MLHFTVLPIISLLLLSSPTLGARNIWPQKLRLPSTTDIKKLSFSEFTYRLHSRQTKYTAVQVVNDICNAYPQDNFNTCYNTVATQIRASAESYCGTKLNQWHQCIASYPADNGTSECTSQEKAYNDCSTFTYQMYEYCLTYAYASVDSVSTCANVELHVRITSSATVITSTTATAAVSASSSAAAAPFQSQTRVSPSGACGTDASGIYTCRGSAFGSCCSSAGMCGSNANSCGVGCQWVFGLCDVLSAPSSTALPSSGTATPITNPGISSSTSTSSLSSISFTYVLNKTTSAPPLSTIAVSLSSTSVPLAPGPVLMSTFSTSTFSTFQPGIGGAGRNGTAALTSSSAVASPSMSGTQMASLTSPAAASSVAAGTGVRSGSASMTGAVATGTAVGAGRNEVCVRRTKVVTLR